MESYIRGLESLGQHQDIYGSLLVPVVLEKLPVDIRRSLARVNVNNDWQLHDLRRAINNEINILEIGSGSSYTLPDVNDHRATAYFHIGTQRKKMAHPYTSKLVKSNTLKLAVRPTCTFCEQDHYSSKCKKIPDSTAGLNIVKQKQLCFNYLRKHRVTRCKSRGRCQNCNRKHHTSICKNPARRPEVTKAQPEAVVDLSSTKKANTDVLLKTAIAPVTSDQTTTEAAILVDEGAQRSYITREHADALQLPSEGRETLSVAGFGGRRSKHFQQMERSTVHILSETKKKIPVSVLIVPTIAAPISCASLRSAATLPYLSGLNLAHRVTSDTSFQISLLVGADHYWEDRIVRGNGPTAVKSKIGYLLSGPMPLTSHDQWTSTY